MKVHWATQIDGVGNRFGFSVHDRRAREALASMGVELCRDAPVSVHVTSPLTFDPPDDGRLHVAYTAWDSTDLPAAARCMGKAGAVICTSSYMVPVLEPVARPGVPFFVCPLGVDAGRLAFPGRRRRLRRAERMRILWIGAPNPRKGFGHALAATDRTTHQTSQQSRVRVSPSTAGGFLSTRWPGCTIARTSSSSRRWERASA